MVLAFALGIVNVVQVILGRQVIGASRSRRTAREVRQQSAAASVLMLGMAAVDLGVVVHERRVIGAGLIVAVLGGGALFVLLKNSAGQASSTSGR